MCKEVPHCNGCLCINYAIVWMQCNTATQIICAPIVGEELNCHKNLKPKRTGILYTILVTEKAVVCSNTTSPEEAFNAGQAKVKYTAMHMHCICNILYLPNLSPVTKWPSLQPNQQDLLMIHTINVLSQHNNNKMSTLWSRQNNRCDKRTEAAQGLC